MYPEKYPVQDFDNSPYRVTYGDQGDYEEFTTFQEVLERYSELRREGVGSARVTAPIFAEEEYDGLHYDQRLAVEDWDAQARGV